MFLIFLCVFYQIKVRLFQQYNLNLHKYRTPQWASMYLSCTDQQSNSSINIHLAFIYLYLTQWGQGKCVVTCCINIQEPTSTYKA